ncbi:Scr1 family TA system antitoxin-like transcriptional regulator [Streptomyces sp. NPDC001750]|uniref:Scr1 family TA system antitoxin-like transcriptional regulator n=1 Tax=Streptomyces sp. NPDC001750 TaxID=3364607 RepID=UPI00368259E3
MEWPISMLRHIESAGRALSDSEATDLLSRYGVVSHEELAGFAAFVGECGTPRSAYRMVDEHHGWLNRLAALEHQAREARVYSQTLIPRFLRTSEYDAACPCPSTAGAPVTRPPVGAEHATVLLESTVLSRPVGGRHILADQLHRLLQIADRGLVHIRIVPVNAQIYAPAAPLTALVLPGDVIVCASEDGDRITYRTGPAETAGMRQFLRRAAAAALPDRASRGLLEQARDAAAAGKLPACL